MEVSAINSQIAPMIILNNPHYHNKNNKINLNKIIKRIFNNNQENNIRHLQINSIMKI